MSSYERIGNQIVRTLRKEFPIVSDAEVCEDRKEKPRCETVENAEVALKRNEKELRQQLKEI